MIRKIKLYIVLVAVLLSASSCLDKYPQDAIPQEEAIKTVSDVRQALVGIYAQFKNASLYSGYLTLLPDIQTDLVYAVKGYPTCPVVHHLKCWPLQQQCYQEQNCNVR